MFLGSVRTCACQNYWTLFFVCLFFPPLLLHCQAVSLQAALFLLDHATAVFFHYISFNRYADFFAALSQFLARLIKLTQFRK